MRDIRKQMRTEQVLAMKSGPLAGTTVIVKSPPRNQPCPCGSGRKYKHCCVQFERVKPVVSTPLPADAPAPEQVQDNIQPNQVPQLDLD
jgi:hypothetical protein